MRSKGFNLKTYSVFACAFLINENAIAEIEYTDIEPDIVLDSDLESAGVDMDNNGTIDFAFLNLSFPYTYFWYSFIEKIFVGPSGTPQNEIAGFYDIRYFPYALNYGDLINDDLSFQNYGFQRMAWRIFMSWDTWEGGVMSGTGYGGEWYPEMFDHYLGVHFIDENADYHYGWIRCDVKDEGRTLVIKDYAYEKLIDYEIIAGDTIGHQPFGFDTTDIHTGIYLENELIGANVYSFESTLFIQLNEVKPDAKVRVYDLTGKEIYYNTLKNVFTEINLQAAKGIYLVELSAEEGKLTKKIYLE